MRCSGLPQWLKGRHVQVWFSRTVNNVVFQLETAVGLTQLLCIQESDEGMAAFSADLDEEPGASGHGHLLSKVKDNEPTTSSADILADGEVTAYIPAVECLCWVQMNQALRNSKQALPVALANGGKQDIVYDAEPLTEGGRSPVSGHRHAARKGHHSRSPEKQRLKLPPRIELATGDAGGP